MTDHRQPKPDDWDEEIDGTWDGDFDPADAADIELITSYLNGQLDPERAAAVRTRLEEDEAFHYLAAPLLLAWSVPKHLERFPRPEGEWERAFADFKRRVGFPNWPPPEPPGPPPKPKRRWRRPLLLFVLLIVTYVWSAESQEWTEPGGPYTEIPFQVGWVSLDDGIEVNIAPGASLRVDRQPRNGMKRVLLDGSARFRVLAHNPDARSLRTQALVVETRAGAVTAGESDFTVTARADTTSVFVLPLGPRRALAPQLRTVMTTTEIDKNSHAGAVLRDNDGARLVRGREPETYTRRLP
jgi:hypothetical protein